MHITRIRMAWIAAAIALAACGGGHHDDHGGGPVQPKLACDDSIKSGFAAESTTVLLVKSFKAGDPLLLSGAATPSTPVASNDVCVVKLLVGRAIRDQPMRRPPRQVSGSRSGCRVPPTGITGFT